MTDRLANEAWSIQAELFDSYRTLMGEGYRASLDLMSRNLPINILNFPTGTKCGSWTIPREWTVREAWVKDPAGNLLVDFNQSTFHIWQYSTPFSGWVKHEDLMAHMAIGNGNGIPLVVTYYKERFGFSISERQKALFCHQDYEVFVDSDFRDGNLLIGEVFLPGTREDEIVIDAVLSCSQLANNLSGVSAAYYLARLLMGMERNYSYRILFTPETIGPIAYYHHHRENAKKAVGGVTLMNLGDQQDLQYKGSRAGNTVVDQAMRYVLRSKWDNPKLLDYEVMTATCGNEKAYNSLGMEIDIGALRRSVPCSYPEYDTSLDTMGFISQNQFREALVVLKEVLQTIEVNEYWEHQFEGEPFLTGYGLLPSIESDVDRIPYDYLMGFTDGKHSVVDLAEMSNIPVSKFQEPIRLMAEKGLIRKCFGPEPSAPPGSHRR